MLCNECSAMDHAEIESWVCSDKCWAAGGNRHCVHIYKCPHCGRDRPLGEEKPPHPGLLEAVNDFLTAWQNQNVYGFEDHPGLDHSFTDLIANAKYLTVTGVRWHGEWISKQAYDEIRRLEGLIRTNKVIETRDKALKAVEDTHGIWPKDALDDDKSSKAVEEGWECPKCLKHNEQRSIAANHPQKWFCAYCGESRPDRDIPQVYARLVSAAKIVTKVFANADLDDVGGLEQLDNAMSALIAVISAVNRHYEKK